MVVVKVSWDLQSENVCLDDQISVLRAREYILKYSSASICEQFIHV